MAAQERAAKCEAASEAAERENLGLEGLCLELRDQVPHGLSCCWRRDVAGHMHMPCLTELGPEARRPACALLKLWKLLMNSRDANLALQPHRGCDVYCDVWSSRCGTAKMSLRRCAHLPCRSSQD